MDETTAPSILVLQTVGLTAVSPGILGQRVDGQPDKYKNRCQRNRQKCNWYPTLVKVLKFSSILITYKLELHDYKKNDEASLVCSFCVCYSNVYFWKKFSSVIECYRQHVTDSLSSRRSKKYMGWPQRPLTRNIK